MAKQSLYILTGLPYAGKTTLRNQLVDQYGFASVSTDEVIDRKGFDAEAMDQSQWDMVYSEAYRELNDFLTAGKTVIVDIGNLKKSERDTARAIGAEHRVDTKLIYIDTTREEILQRRARNEQTQERGQLTESLLNRAFDMFEPPTPEEQPIHYNQTMPIDEWMLVNIEGKQTSLEGRI